MKIIVSIDDTDQLSTKGVKGTGDVAEAMAAAIEKNQWGTAERITRHQLLLHKDIPYTSHNSAMSFTAQLYNAALLPEVIHFCSRFLEEESEPEADPGLCIGAVERLISPDSLIAFGGMAKREVLTKDQAYLLAKEIGIHLSEHGGTGQGVIGALAGAGLRLSGNDGAFKNKHKLGEPGMELSVSEICQRAGVDRIKNSDGHCLDGDSVIILGNMVKSILSEGLSVIPVEPAEPVNGQKRWITCSREQIHRQQGNNRT